LPFKMRRPTRRHYFLRVNFRPFSFFTHTTRAKINLDNMIELCMFIIVSCYFSIDENSSLPLQQRDKQLPGP